MTTRSQNLRHRFEGGWATDLGPTVDVVPDESGKVPIPFLTAAENVFYELDGGVHKIGGTAKLNSSALESGAVIRGLYDYWAQGTLGAPVRRRVVHVSDKVLRDADDGNFATTLFSGLSSTAVPNYSTFDDLLIMANDSTTDVPKSFDGTTAQNLAGSPPRFSFSVVHHGRQFAAGNYTSPSTIYYTSAFNPEDWIGAGSGSILIEPNDGDMITGLASFKNELWIFKGPNKGSINRLVGSTPSTFALEPFIKSGLGAAWQNSIFQFKDDLGFVSQYGTVHSLVATSAFGDFNEAALSLPIHGWLREHLNYNRLRFISAANDPLNGYVLFTLAIDSSTNNNIILMMDYRRYPQGPVRWASWPAKQAGALNLFVDTNGLRRILLGGNDGYVRRDNVLDRSIDGTTAYTAKATTPHLNYGDPMLMKNITAAAVGLAPKGNYDLTFTWMRDDASAQSVTLDQGGGDVLGPAAANEFTLGTSQLSGARFVDRYVELVEGGEFRSISYQLTQSGLSEGMEVHSFSATVKAGSMSTEN